MGRDKNNELRGEKVTTMKLSVMQTAAWRALSTTAQALYTWIKHEWRGKGYNNNGKLRLSVRQAAGRIGCARNTAMKAFRELQAKGFIVQTEGGCLGTEGHGKAPMFELTEEPAAGEKGPGRQWYLRWSEGNDFPVKRGHIGHTAKQTQKAEPRLNSDDSSVAEFGTKR